MPKILQGIRILDFSRAVAGAYTTQLLGNMGMEIIKIEEVPTSEPPCKEPNDIEVSSRITSRWAVNLNKKGICLDMKKESARAVLYEMVKVSDVVFDNYRPHVLKDLGIEYETLKKYNPRIISCSVSGFGQNGPWKEVPAYDLIAQAMGGGMSITGEPGRMPIMCGMQIGDLTASTYAAFAIVCAILSRDQTGNGQRIDLSMLDCQLALQGFRVPQAFGMGMEFGPTPRRVGDRGQVPFGVYKTRDSRWIAITAGEAHFWEPLCKAIGREDLMSDPQFFDNAKRLENAELVEKIFEQAFAFKTADEWERILMEAKVPSAKVNTIKEAFEHPQAQARNMLVSVDHPLGKKMKFAGNPIKVPSLNETEKFEPCPALGEHTREVLSTILDYSEDKLANLKEEGAIWWSEKGLNYTHYYDKRLGTMDG